LPYQKHGVAGVRHLLQKTKEAADRFRERYGVIQRRRRLHQRHDLVHGGAKCGQALMQAAFALGRANPLQLPADRVQEGVAIQILVFVEIISDSHAHGVQRRGLVGETSHHDGHHVRIELRQVLQQLQAVVAGAQGPVEDGQVDDMFIGQHQGGFGIGGAEYPAAQAGAVEPFAKGFADRFLVVHDQDGIGRLGGGCHADGPQQCFPVCSYTSWRNKKPQDQ
jgi:hypothetical protein